MNLLFTFVLFFGLIRSLAVKLHPDNVRIMNEPTPGGICYITFDLSVQVEHSKDKWYVEPLKFNIIKKDDYTKCQKITLYIFNDNADINNKSSYQKIDYNAKNTTKDIIYYTSNSNVEVKEDLKISFQNYKFKINYFDDNSKDPCVFELVGINAKELSSQVKRLI